MSSYTDYTAVSQNYDRTRVPVGVEIILGCLAHGPKPLHEITLLDAGCGTGSYTQALLHHVHHVEAVDLNQGMLTKARAKVAHPTQQGRVNFHRGALEDLPLPDQSVDAVMVNQVLHHLPDDPGAGWPLLQRVLAEFARVLRPGGVLVINICSQEQLRRGWWYCDLVPDAVLDIQGRHVDIGDLVSMMNRCGFSHRGRFVPVDALFQGDDYFRGLGPTDERWRQSDSLWELVDAPQLARVQSQVMGLHERGELDGFVADRDAHRLQIGQVTFLCGLRQ